MVGIERPFQLVGGRAGVAAALLDARLVTEASQRVAGSARGLRHRIERRQGRELVDAERAQRLDLGAPDAGHVAEVIVGAPARLAGRPPRAVVAVRDEVGIGGFVAGQEPVDAAFEQTEIGAEIVDPVAHRLEVGARRHDVHPGGTRALDPLEQIRIHAELQDRAALGFAGELGVAGLVRPGAEAARCGDLAQEVDTAGPRAELERGLVEDVHAGAHGGQRRRGAKTDDPASSPRRRRRLRRRRSGPARAGDRGTRARAQVHAHAGPR